MINISRAPLRRYFSTCSSLRCPSFPSLYFVPTFASTSVKSPLLPPTHSASNYEWYDGAGAGS